MCINMTWNAGTRKKNEKEKKNKHGPLPTIGTCTRTSRIIIHT